MSIRDILVAMTSYPMRTDDPGATFLRHVPVEGDEEKRPRPARADRFLRRWRAAA